ncbi:helix-turn-helix transcriptional regulator [Nocardia sp. CNY236]|uniref:ArsR/SmtB family transcription factor n=1 Tax=Nocardia sp. CNY236 TaxID=1169152 RepID=UPI0003F87D79|nr:metalloregulator ArsR/SmtB family transcription factor [Nocardia sp. CNY236]
MPDDVDAGDIDAVFKALANPARRNVITRLAYGPATTSALAGPLDMSLAAVVQHLQHLESAGLVVSRKVGRIRVHELRKDGLLRLERWSASRRNRHEARLDRLAEAVAALTAADSADQTDEKGS